MPQPSNQRPELAASSATGGRYPRHSRKCLRAFSSTYASALRTSVGVRLTTWWKRVASTRPRRPNTRFTQRAKRAPQRHKSRCPLASPLAPTQAAPELRRSPDGTAAARPTDCGALHAVGQLLLVVRLHQKMRMVVLQRVVDNPEPGTLRPLAQRVPERPREAPPPERRHVLLDAQGDQHRAATRDRLPRPVRHPRLAHALAARAGTCAAAAGRPELERGLLGILATFPLHCGGHRWVLRAVPSLRPTTVHVNSIQGQIRSFLRRFREGRRRSVRRRNIAPFNRGCRHMPNERSAGFRPPTPVRRCLKRAMFRSGGTSIGGLSTPRPRRRSPQPVESRWARGG